MPILDVFDNDAFTSVSLTESVERNPYLPTGLGTLKIFQPKPILTKALAVEQREGRLVVVPTSDRGGPVMERITEKRQARYFEVPRIATGDTVYASELMGVRKFGSETQMMSVQDEVTRRLNGGTGLLKNIEFTHEYHRLAAVQGLLLDANPNPGQAAPVLFNWYDEFNITQPAPIAFNLAAKTSGQLRVTCNQMVRKMTRAAKGAFGAGARVIGLCGDEFWDALTTHPDVNTTYLNWAQAEELRLGMAFMGDKGANPLSSNPGILKPFPFGDVAWINYRGSDDLATIAIPSTQAIFFPDNADDVFTVAWAPHDNEEFLDTLGRPTYIIPIKDRDRRAWWRMEAYSYPLHICTRPEVLQRGNM